jgi:hypothetical protein
MRLFVRISALSPFALVLHDDLSVEHYDQIVNNYYKDIYSGTPPGPLHLHKVIHLASGDKMFEYQRQASND